MCAQPKRQWVPKNTTRPKANITEKALAIASAFFLAGVEGLEPSQTVLETGVLPLTPYPYIKMKNEEQ